MDNIEIIKTTQGEFLIGKVAAETKDEVFIAWALTLDYRIDKTTLIPIVYFYKYCLYNSSYELILGKDFIMNRFEDPLPYIKNQYIKAIDKYKKHDAYIKELEENGNALKLAEDNVFNLFSPKDDDSIH